jgi:hypothetical protein
MLGARSPAVGWDRARSVPWCPTKTAVTCGRTGLSAGCVWR